MQQTATLNTTTYICLSIAEFIQQGLLPYQFVLRFSRSRLQRSQRMCTESDSKQHKKLYCAGAHIVCARRHRFSAATTQSPP